MNQILLEMRKNKWVGKYAVLSSTTCRDIHKSVTVS